MRFSMVVTVLMLSGVCASALSCASNSGIVNEGRGNYFIAKQGASGFTNTVPLRADALEEAHRFCQAQPSPNNDMFVTHTSEVPPGPFGQFPKFEVNFRCGGPSVTADAAIAECREKRTRGELKSFKASVECSNPKIYAAWKEVGDPNLDLVNVFLAARLVGAENVDRGKITEGEYQLQLAELNSRITEEKRRRASTDAQASANLQATQALSDAALLHGLAAFQSASRPAR